MPTGKHSWKEMSALSKSLAATVVALVLGLSASVGASASGNPDRQLFPPPPDLVGPLCGAAMGTIIAHVSVDREYIKTYVSSNGTTKYEVNGTQIDTITGNGKTVTINASGPGSITIFPDGKVVQVLQGHTSYFNTPDKGIFLFDGLVVVDTSNGTIAGHNGHVTDVCALLR